MQDYFDNYRCSVVTFHQLLGLENKFKRHLVVEINSGDDLIDVFQKAMDSRAHLLYSLHDNYLGTYYVWSDGSYCLDEEASEFQWKSDDYYIIRISEKLKGKDGNHKI
jgi:hypothetical protein